LNNHYNIIIFFYIFSIFWYFLFFFFKKNFLKWHIKLNYSPISVRINSHWEMLRNIIFSAFCIVMLKEMSKGMRIEQKENISDVCLEFHLFQIEGLTWYKKELIFSPTKVSKVVAVNLETLAFVEMLARRPIYHLLVGSYDRN